MPRSTSGALNGDGAGHITLMDQGPSFGRMVTRLHAAPTIDVCFAHRETENLELNWIWQAIFLLALCKLADAGKQAGKSNGKQG
jgi:hypothetical protein